MVAYIVIRLFEENQFIDCLFYYWYGVSFVEKSYISLQNVTKTFLEVIVECKWNKIRVNGLEMLCQYLSIYFPVFSLTNSQDFLVETFGGKKRFILTTGSWIGGKNPFLGICYIVIGSLCVVFGFVFLIIHKKRTKYVQS